MTEARIATLRREMQTSVVQSMIENDATKRASASAQVRAQIQEFVSLNKAMLVKKERPTHRAKASTAA